MTSQSEQRQNEIAKPEPAVAEEFDLRDGSHELYSDEPRSACGRGCSHELPRGRAASSLELSEVAGLGWL